MGGDCDSKQQAEAAATKVEEESSPLHTVEQRQEAAVQCVK